MTLDKYLTVISTMKVMDNGTNGNNIDIIITTWPQTSQNENLTSPDIKKKIAARLKPSCIQSGSHTFIYQFNKFQQAKVPREKNIFQMITDLMYLILQWIDNDCCVFFVKEISGQHDSLSRSKWSEEHSFQLI